MALFQYLWRFAQICTDLHRYDHKIVFVIVACLKLFRNNNKNNFASISVQICANLHKSWNNTMSNDGLIIENIEAVSYSFSCTIVRLRYGRNLNGLGFKLWYRFDWSLGMSGNGNTRNWRIDNGSSPWNCQRMQGSQLGKPTSLITHSPHYSQIIFSILLRAFWGLH